VAGELTVLAATIWGVTQPLRNFLIDIRATYFTTGT
jgi:hypothetical protein